MFRQPDDIDALQRELAAVRDAPLSDDSEPGDQPTLPGLDSVRGGATRPANDETKTADEN